MGPAAVERPSIYHGPDGQRGQKFAERGAGELSQPKPSHAQDPKLNQGGEGQTQLDCTKQKTPTGKRGARPGRLHPNPAPFPVGVLVWNRHGSGFSGRARRILNASQKTSQCASVKVPPARDERQMKNRPLATPGITQTARHRRDHGPEGSQIPASSRLGREALARGGCIPTRLPFQSAYLSGIDTALVSPAEPRRFSPLRRKRREQSVCQIDQGNRKIFGSGPTTPVSQ